MTTAFIFARGGSKGVLGKNIRPLSGKPLIGWSIEQARQVPEISRVIVSTDSQEIAEISRQFGAETPFLRPAILSSDDASEWDAWRHALNFLLEEEGCIPEFLVSVPATSPLRLSEDIRKSIEKFRLGQFDSVVCVPEPHRNPSFNMISVGEQGQAEIAIKAAATYLRRQDAPEVFDLTTVCFVVDTQFILSGKSLFHGKVGILQVPIERSIDIDTEYDFEIAEFLMNKRLRSASNE